MTPTDPATDSTAHAVLGTAADALATSPDAPVLVVSEADRTVIAFPSEEAEQQSALAVTAPEVAAADAVANV